MEVSDIGSVELCSIDRYDWVIENFKDLVQGHDSGDVIYSPKFLVKGLEFGLALELEEDEKLIIFLANYSTNAHCVSFFSLHLVGIRGTTLKMRSHAGSINGNHWLERGKLVQEKFRATVRMQDINFRFLTNGNIRIRCQLELVRKETDEAAKPKQAPSLVDKIRNQIGDPRFCDFTLVCSGREFRVHRLILGLQSPVFSAMFEREGFKEAKTGRVVIEDVQPQTLESLLQFAYTEQVSGEHLTPELLMAANKYLMETLAYKCESKLSKALSVDNAADYFLLACQHNAKNLKTFAQKFIVDNFEAVEQTEGFRSTIARQPEALVEIMRYACKK